jgi:hypothetical protein
MLFGRLDDAVTAPVSLSCNAVTIRSPAPLPWIFQPRRVFIFLIALTRSASLIGAISAENAEFSQDNRKEAEEDWGAKRWARGRRT